MNRVAFRKQAEIPFAPAAIVRATVDAAGRPLLALVEAAGSELARAGGDAATVPRGFAAHPYRLTVAALDGRRWEPVAHVVADQVWPHVQALSSGRLVVAATYSRRAADGTAEANCSVYDARGELERRFVLGDGLEELLATSDDELWAAYSSQGVTGDYGRLGWGRLSPDEWVEPVGSAGLVRFDVLGNRRYAFEPTGELQAVVDCYALNASGAEAWASYHPRFPVVYVAADRTVRGWQTGLAGPVDALAVAGASILLRTRSQRAHRYWLGRLGDADVVDGLAELAPTVSGDARVESLDRVVGRGRSLHAFGAGGYYRLDLDA